MNKNYIFNILFLVFVTASTNIFSQVKIDSNQEQEILNICNQYIVELNLVYSDTSYNFENLERLAGEDLTKIIRLNSEYFSLKGYKDVKTNLISATKVIISDTAIECKMANKNNLDVFLTIKKEAETFKVVGMNGSIVSKEEIEQLQAIVDNEIAVRNTVYKYIQGLNDLLVRGDSTLILKTASYNEFKFWKNYDETKLINGYPLNDWVIYDIYNFEVDQQNASCRVDIESNGSIGLILKNENNEWKVIGTDDEITTDSIVIASNNKLTHLREKVKIKTYLIEELNSAITDYFLSIDNERIKSYCTPSFFIFLEKVKNKFGVCMENHLQVRGLDFNYIRYYDYSLSNDNLVIKYRDGAVHFKFDNDTWKLSSINRLSSDALNDYYIEENFKMIKQIFKIYYLYSNPNGEDDEIEEVEISSEDNTIYHHLNNFETASSFGEGTESIFNYISNYFKKNKVDLNQTGYVYVSFVIEKNGALTNIEVLKSPNSYLSAQAIKLVKSMPKWNPAINYGMTVRSSYVLPISFE